MTTRCCAPQVTERQGAEAASISLGVRLGQSQAQLDGFRTRAARAEAPAQRHLYATEWRSLDGRPRDRVLRRPAAKPNAEAQTAATKNSMVSAEAWSVTRRAPPTPDTR